MIFKILRSKAGVGMTQALIGAGMMGGLATAMMTIFGNMNKAQKSMEAQYEIMAVFNQIRSYVANKTNCTKTFTTPGAINADSTPAGTINSIIIQSGATDVNRFETFNSSNRKYGQGKIKILDYALSSNEPEVEIPPGAGEGTTHFIVRFEKSDDRIINRKMMINVKVDGSHNILECVASLSDDDMMWGNNGTNGNISYMNGNVGIGTENPAALLDVNGNAVIRGDLDIQNNLNVGQDLTVAGELTANGLMLNQVAEPATPPAGKGIIYLQSDGKLYLKNDTGTVYDLTSGTGSGGDIACDWSGAKYLSYGFDGSNSSQCGATFTCSGGKIVSANRYAAPLTPPHVCPTP